MDFMQSEFYGNPVSAYAIFLGFVAGAWAAARIARLIILKHVAKWVEKTESKWDDVIIDAVKGPAVWLVVVGGMTLAREGLVLSPKAILWTNRALTAGVVFTFFVAAYRLIRGGADLMAEEYVKKKTAEGADEAEIAATVRQVARIKRQVSEVAGMVIILLALLTTLSNLGVDLKAIWASLGIGGIALALAVKDPLANIVGRMYIYSTGIFDEGQAIEFEKWSGTVTKIGVFRTSMELSSDLAIVTIPNAEFITKAVKNNFGRTRFVYKWDLDLPYAVKADKIEELISRLKEHLLAKPEVIPGQTYVYLDRLDKQSKVVRVWFQVKLPDWPASAQYGSKVLGEIQRIFDSMDLDFAYPTYTVKIEGGVGEKAKAPVEESR
ncbi:mechanosensitive ion channel [bacterium]|nr:MAG: mechanosensitive ion channel [bacterium]